MSDDLANLTDLTFEDAYAQLEEIAAQLESGDLSLDESVALYERGQALARHCSDLLDAAELRIRQINDAGDVSPLS
jgi:exodeoxyribonuclease VII small subunit